jgi:hypothetical protein
MDKYLETNNKRIPVSNTEGKNPNNIAYWTASETAETTSIQELQFVYKEVIMSLSYTLPLLHVVLMYHLRVR